MRFFLIVAAGVEMVNIFITFNPLFPRRVGKTDGSHVPIHTREPTDSQDDNVHVGRITCKRWREKNLMCIFAIKAATFFFSVANEKKTRKNFIAGMVIFAAG